MKTALILDLSNLYFEIRTAHGRQNKLQIVEYVRQLETDGHLITYKVAYSQQCPELLDGFIKLLEFNGFETYFDDRNWTVDMALKTADTLSSIDALVVGANNDCAYKLLAYAKSKGKITKCFATNIPNFFRKVATCVEIPKTLLIQ